MGAGDTGAQTASRFPTTRWTLIREARDPGSPAYRESLGHLANLYWRPVYAYFRRRWSRQHDDAADLTQEFFHALCEKNFLDTLLPEHGRFRSYVMAALDNFAKLDHRSRSTLKRGGSGLQLPLAAVQEFQPSESATPEQILIREWSRSVMTQALRDLEQEYREAGQEQAFAVFSARDLEGSPEGKVRYQDLAQRFGLSETDVTNYIYRARKRLRELVLSQIRDTVSSEEEAESELRDLFGPDAFP